MASREVFKRNLQLLISTNYWLVLQKEKRSNSKIMHNIFVSRINEIIKCVLTLIYVLTFLISVQIFDVRWCVETLGLLVNKIKLFVHVIRSSVWIADDRVVNSGIILEVDLLGVSEFLILMWRRRAVALWARAAWFLRRPLGTQQGSTWTSLSVFRLSG